MPATLDGKAREGPNLSKLLPNCVDRDPLAALGLPAPDAARLADPALAQRYAEFAAKLKWVDGCQAINCEAALQTRDIADYPTLALTHAILRLGPNDWPDLADRLQTARWEYRRQRVKARDLAAAHRNLKAFARTDDFRVLTRHLAPVKSLGGLQAVLYNPVSADPREAIEVRLVSPGWAAVVGWIDPRPEPTYLYPMVAGFFACDNFLWNLSRLLRSFDTFSLWGDPSESSAWGDLDPYAELLFRCWVKEGEIHIPAEYLDCYLKMNADGLNYLINKYGSLHDERLLTWLERIGADIDLPAAAATYGGLHTPGFLRHRLDHTRALRRERQEAERHEAELAALVRATPALSPLDLPPGFAVDQLTELQCRLLAKWLADNLLLVGTEVEYGAGADGWCFTIAFSCRGKKHTARFQADGHGESCRPPSVLAAFHTALTGLAGWPPA